MKPVRPISSSSINKDELAKFSAMADSWWDPAGKFKPLHRFNPVRVEYLRDQLCRHFGRKAGAFDALKGLRVLDIGCGGGLLCEPLARLGAIVTGIDPGTKNIGVASLHAEQMGLEIDYRALSVEDVVKNNETFDVVLVMEVVEHVDHVPDFLEACAKAVAPGGLIFVATLNRTIKSFAMAKVGAEYILRWLPVGTHDWHKFLRPSEITKPLQDQQMEVKEIKGVSFDLISRQWKLSQDVSVNYMVLAERGKKQS